MSNILNIYSKHNGSLLVISCYWVWIYLKIKQKILVTINRHGYHQLSLVINCHLRHCHYLHCVYVHRQQNSPEQCGTIENSVGCTRPLCRQCTKNWTLFLASSSSLLSSPKSSSGQENRLHRIGWCWSSSQCPVFSLGNDINVGDVSNLLLTSLDDLLE